MLPDVAGIPRVFAYAVPPELDAEVRLGGRVRVRLHGRRVAGWVVEDPTEVPAGVRLQAISKSSGMGPPGELIELARWASWRWCGPVSGFLDTASPDRVVDRPVPPSRSADAGAERGGGDGSVDDAIELAMSAPGSPVVARVAPLSDLMALVLRFCERAGGEGVSPATVLLLAPSLDVADRLAGLLERRDLPVARAGVDWAKAAGGWPVVVGARSAAWSPPGRLAGALVIDAHDEAYREERAPTWNAWEVVAERCARDRAPCLLVSPVPGPELLDRGPLWTEPRPQERRGWPLVQVEDRRAADPRTGLLSELLVQRIRHVLEGARAPGGSGGEFRPVVCVLNRRGRARLLACTACRELARCERCGGPVEQDGTGSADAQLRCRRCGEERPFVCAACGSTRLKVLRIGVSRVREELEALLRCEVVEVSGPEVRPVPTAPVLVGTEAVLHRVRRAGLVAFLDFDQHLLAPSFTAVETALALLVRAARMVGRGERSGGPEPARIVVQTRLPGHAVLEAVRRGDPGPCLQEDREAREALGLPPSVAWAVVSGPSAGELLQPLLAGEVEGLVPLDEGRWLLRAPDHQELCDALARLPRPKGRVRIEVDPLRI